MASTFLRQQRVEAIDATYVNGQPTLWEGVIPECLLLKEQLRQILYIKDKAAIPMLQEWIAWVVRSRIPPFVDLARRVQANLSGILQALLNNLSYDLLESTNTKLRVLTRIASGFNDPALSPTSITAATARPSPAEHEHHLPTDPGGEPVYSPSGLNAGPCSGG